MAKSTFERSKPHVNVDATPPAVVNGLSLRTLAGNPAVSSTSPEAQQRLRDTATEAGLNPDRLYFIGDAMCYDAEGPEPYDRAAREKAVHRESREMSRYDHSSSVTLALEPPPTTFSGIGGLMNGSRGKIGKDKTTRRFEIPR